MVSDGLRAIGGPAWVGIGPPLIVFPAYQLLVVEERLREQEAQGVRLPDGMGRDELALRILIAAALMAERSATQ